MTWIERRLEELAAEGFFEGLPGSGRPIADLEVEYSPAWWATRWVQRDAARRDSETVRRNLAQDVAAALGLARPAARERLQSIKDAVVALNAHLDSAQQLPEFDVDTVLIRGRWPP